MTDFDAFRAAISIALDAAKLRKEAREMRYRMENNGRYVVKLFDSRNLREYRLASWQLVQLPGCCGIVVSTDATIQPDFRRKGWGYIFNQVRQEQAKLMGYGQLLCTVQATNEAEIKILKKNNWHEISGIVNPKTNNKILTYVWDCSCAV